MAGSSDTLSHVHDELGAHTEFDVTQPVRFNGIEYEFTGGVLGSGSFGCVYDAESEGGERLAVKVLDTDRMSAWAMRQYESECQLWALAGEHEHIVRYLGHLRLGKWLLILSEPADGGELMDHIAMRAQFTEAEAMAIVRQLLSAVERLHSLRIVHRDIKPENVLCVSAPSGETSAAGGAHPWHIKLCDLGHARVLGEGDLLSTPCGSTGYMAPEVRARGRGGDGDGYTERADMWSVGCVCHLLLSGAPLSAAAATPAPPGLSEPIWASVSTDGRAFVRALLVADPAARPTATEALQHRWLQGAPSTPLQTPLAVRRARQQAEAAAALLEGGAQATWWATRPGCGRGSGSGRGAGGGDDDDPMGTEDGDGGCGSSSTSSLALLAADAVGDGGGTATSLASAHPAAAFAHPAAAAGPSSGEHRLPVAGERVLVGDGGLDQLPDGGGGRRGEGRRGDAAGRPARRVQAPQVRGVGVARRRARRARSPRAGPGSQPSEMMRQARPPARPPGVAHASHPRPIAVRRTGSRPASRLACVPDVSDLHTIPCRPGRRRCRPVGSILCGSFTIRVSQKFSLMMRQKLPDCLPIFPSWPDRTCSWRVVCDYTLHPVRRATSCAAT